MAIPENRIKFDKTINLGHVLTFVGFIITGMAMWSTLEKRLVVLEEARSSARENEGRQRERDLAQDALAKEKFQEVRDSIRELKASVEKVADKIGAR